MYVPPVAEAGTATDKVGFQVAVLSPTPSVPVTTGRPVPDSVIGVPVAVIVPVVVIEPGSYPTSEAWMVSAAVPAPVVKSLLETVTVHEADNSARSSVTDIGPIEPDTVVPGAPEPRSTETGAEIVNAPLVTLSVTVLSYKATQGKTGKAKISR